MKKLFTTLFAVAAVAFALTSCDQKKDAAAEQPQAEAQATEAEANPADEFIAKFEAFVVKVEAAKTAEEKEALQPEWEALGKEFAEMKFNEEQQKKFDELYARAEAAELVVALPETKE